MRTVTKNIYEFSELSEPAKQKAVQNHSDINTNDSWWDSIYSDAKEIGLKIESFDLDRSRHATGELINSHLEVISAIKENHGDVCDTYKLAIEYDRKWIELVSKHSDGTTLDKVTEEQESDFDQEADELEFEFEKELLECYSIILQKEYEYLYSEEAIIETIEANEYEFDEQGNIYRS